MPVWEVKCVKCKKQGLLRAGDNILQHFKQKKSLVSAEKAQLCHYSFLCCSGKECWRKQHSLNIFLIPGVRRQEEMGLGSNGIDLF